MKNFIFSRREISVYTTFLLSVVASFSLWAQTAPPTIGQAFSPDLIVPGGQSTLTFTIEHPAAGTNVSFSSSLPLNVVIATPSNAASSCLGNGRLGGILTAPAGGSTISFAMDAIAAGVTCAIKVDVTSSVESVYVNSVVTLSSSGGSYDSNTATLTVAAPGGLQFSKAFSPTTVAYGGRARLTFTIDNSTGGNIQSLNFSDNFPVGMVIAEPANLTSNCAWETHAFATVTTSAVPDSGVFSYSVNTIIPSNYAGETCEIALDVVANSTGVLHNVSEELLTDFSISHARAVASLAVSGGEVELTQAFTGDPVNAGSTAGIAYRVQNNDRNNPASNITFSNNLGASLFGLALDVSVPLDPCGVGSAIVNAGTGNFSLVGGSLAAEGSCEFTLSVNVPAGAATGGYPNTTSIVSAEINAQAVSGEAGTDTLFVAPVPMLTKTFQSDTATAGGTIDLEFSVTNTSAFSTATDITFIDELTTFLPFPIGVTLPADPCGVGSTLALISLGTDRQALNLIDGTLAASATCAFTVQLSVPVGVASGVYVNTTEIITATIDGETVIGARATDSFAVIAPPTLAKEFIDDPVSAGDLVTLEFTLTHDQAAPGDATAITFTDDLSGAVAGMAADDQDLPEADVCGTGSSLSGTTTLTFSGGTLAADETCSFSVDVRVPVGTASGSYQNNTSAVEAQVLGQIMLGQVATTDLQVGGVILTKVFVPGETLPGTSVDATYTLMNISDSDASGILVIDALDELLTGFAATPGILPLADVCGTGSSLSLTGGGNSLTLIGGSVVAGSSCSFTVSMDIPAGTPSATYSSSTSTFNYTLLSGQTFGVNAVAELTINSDFLSLSKEFFGDPVRPGESAVLRFTMNNLHATEAISDIAFTDDLDAALSNMTALGLPLSVCGGTASTATGAVIDFSGGTLAAGTSCSFDVDVSVDPSTPLGSVALNETSTIEGTLLSQPVSGDIATDEMEVHFISFSKGFAGEALVQAGDTIELSFTLGNASQNERVSDLSFSDDLDAMISGAVAVGLPMLDVCGTGSQIDGTSVVTLQNASLLPVGSCTVTIEVQIPLATAEDIYTNTTSDVFWNGVASADPATATVEVLPPPDSDGDGVLDDVDVCLNTVIPESVPTQSLKPNRYALVDGDTIFDVGSSSGKSKKSKKSKKSGKSGKSDKGPAVFTIEDTGGCSCEQIIDAVGLGNGHTKFGCSKGAMSDWVEFINSPSLQW